MTNEPPICYNCKRKRPATSDLVFVCDAFPAGIPPAIIENRADHREPFEGDRGLRYDPIDDWPTPQFDE